jgi:hypothetical protein
MAFHREAGASKPCSMPATRILQSISICTLPLLVLGVTGPPPPTAALSHTRPLAAAAPTTIVTANPQASRPHRVITHGLRHLAEEGGAQPEGSHTASVRGPTSQWFLFPWVLIAGGFSAAVAAIWRIQRSAPVPRHTNAMVPPLSLSLAAAPAVAAPGDLAPRHSIPFGLFSAQPLPPLAWITLPEPLQRAINDHAGTLAPLVSTLLFIVINQQINRVRKEQESKAALEAGKAIVEATERTIRSVTPEQWGKLVICVLIDLAGDASFLLPGLGELSDVVYAPLEAVLLSRLFKSNALGLLGGLEEFLPFTDEIPAATLGWILETFFAESPLGKLLGLKFPDVRAKEEADQKSDRVP